jgi:hypothetical protein
MSDIRDVWYYNTIPEEKSITDEANKIKRKRNLICKLIRIFRKSNLKKI